MRHDDAVRELINEQFADYETAKQQHEWDEWCYCIKQYIDWFVIKYDRLLEKRCRQAAMKLCMRGDAWRDLKSECIIEAYRIGERFDPSKGTLDGFLLASLWNFMFSTKHIRNYTITAWGGNEEGVESYEHFVEDKATPLKSTQAINLADCTKHSYLQDFCVSDEPNIDSLLGGLEQHEKLLLNFKLVLKMNNCRIAEILGTCESNIRYRLTSVLGKLKIRGV